MLQLPKQEFFIDLEATGLATPSLTHRENQLLPQLEDKTVSFPEVKNTALLQPQHQTTHSNSQTHRQLTPFNVPDKNPAGLYLFYTNIEQLVKAEGHRSEETCLKSKAFLLTIISEPN